MRQRLCVFLLAAMLLLTLCSCSKSGQVSQESSTMQNSSDQADDHSDSGEDAIDSSLASGDIRAMLLTDSYGNRYYVDIQIGTFFTCDIPDDLTDSDGANLNPEDLSAGDILDITGPGMMCESYPGQYPGVTKMVRVKKGTPKDTAEYQDLIDSVSSTGKKVASVIY